ncbi:cupin [Candidatus Pacearchaeota archaeon CG_4_9_14_0_2_um_filter_39_13]|nr:cupin domain-containing protein [Candidatus Pacearchaeota archaeon]OIO43862.1 MAG: cupin [Candidatus Pacearchaeota archaeon CG1_02_39_14]PJC44711.1 MAG: cupin [Candidatus Pacearchaeota archaeon CG_4_9_14_0_2_um_filter_39_13]
MEKGNLFSKISDKLPKELFQILASSKNIKIERIVSKGHITPENKWYNQEKNEFVLLIKGYAEILFADNKLVRMNEGDYINIPSHKEHRVVKTSSEEETIWLAVFY